MNGVEANQGPLRISSNRSRLSFMRFEDGSSRRLQIGRSGGETHERKELMGLRRADTYVWSYSPMETQNRTAVIRSKWSIHLRRSDLRPSQSADAAR